MYEPLWMIRSELCVMLKWWPYSSVFSWALCPTSVWEKIKNVRKCFFHIFRMQFFQVFPKQLISNYLRKLFCWMTSLVTSNWGCSRINWNIFNCNNLTCRKVTYFSPSKSNFTHRYDIQTPNELSLHIHLWISWPVRVCLETLANLMKII